MEWHGYSSEQIVLKNYIEHHGIKGQRWGVRRYQNLDGTLTDAGRAHYGTGVTINKELKDRMDKYAGEISILNAQSLNNAENFRYFNSILPKADKTMTKYFNALSEKGYGCIFDDQDKMIANTPFIIFDKSVLEKLDLKSLTRR